MFTFPFHFTSLFPKLNLGRIKLTNRNWYEIALEIQDYVFQGKLFTFSCKDTLKKEIIKPLIIFDENINFQIFSTRAPYAGFLSPLTVYLYYLMGLECLGWGQPDIIIVSFGGLSGEGIVLGSIATKDGLQVLTRDSMSCEYSF